MGFEARYPSGGHDLPSQLELNRVCCHPAMLTRSWQAPLVLDFIVM